MIQDESNQKVYFYDVNSDIPFVMPVSSDYHRCSLRFHRSGDRIAFHSYEESGCFEKKGSEWSISKRHKSKKWTRDMQWSADGSELYEMSSEKGLYVWNQTSGWIHELKGHQFPVTKMISHPKRKLVITGGQEGEIRIWEGEPTPFRTAVRDHVGGPEFTSIVGFAENGRKLIRFNHHAIHEPNGEIGVNDLLTGEFKKIVIEDAEKRFAIPRFETDLQPEGTCFAIVARNGTDVQLYHSVTGKLRHTLKCEKITSTVAFSRDGKKLLTAGISAIPGSKIKPNHESHVEIWDVETGEKSHSHSSIAEGANVWCLSRDGSRFYCAAIRSSRYQLDPHESMLTAYDSATGRILYEKQITSQVPTSLRICSEDKFMCVTTFTNRLPTSGMASPNGVLIFDAASGKFLHGFLGPQSAISASFQPTGKRLAVVGYDGNPVIYDYERGLELMTLFNLAPPRMEDYAINACVRWSQDGHKIACNSWRDVVTIWDDNVKPAKVTERKK